MHAFSYDFPIVKCKSSRVCFLFVLHNDLLSCSVVVATMLETPHSLIVENTNSNGNKNKIAYDDISQL